MSNRIILVGHGGGGKDFLRKKFEARGFEYQVSYTTRPPREGEINGKDYYFIAKEEADKMTQNDEWYESVEFNGWLYGTTKKQFHAEGCPIFIMTPSGLQHIKPEDRETSFIIFVNPPSEIIDERLKKRNMPGDSAGRRRLADIEQFTGFTDFDIQICNPDF